MAEKGFKLGSSVFWGLIIAISLGGLTYLAVWSYHNNSVKGAIMSFIFFSMIIFGILLSKFEIFNSGTWGTNTLTFSLGMVLWLIIGGAATGSVISYLSITTNSLLASIAAELPESLEFVMNALVIPISEEAFWMIGIPFFTFWLLDTIGAKFRLFKNLILQIIILAILTGVTFAIFHVGKLLLAFLIVAFVFRTLLIVSVWGDMKLNIIPGIELVPAFALGAHVGNNWASFGLLEGFRILWANPAIGMVVFAILGVIFLSALNQFIIGAARLFGKVMD